MPSRGLRAAPGSRLARGGFQHAVPRRVEVVALQHLQAQADRVGGRWRHHQEADEAFAALDHRPHDQRLQAVEIEPALGIAGGALRPALPGATIAQICEATGWQQHTVRGFFAGLKKRQGIEVQVLERVRQVGPNKEGARGSYTIYHLPA